MRKTSHDHGGRPKAAADHAHLVCHRQFSASFIEDDVHLAEIFKMASEQPEKGEDYLDGCMSCISN